MNPIAHEKTALFLWDPFGIHDMLRQYQYENRDVVQPVMQASDPSGRSVASLVEDYRSAVVLFFRRRLHNSADAEDAAQEVFANLSRKAEVDSIENVEGYIFQAAANHLRDRFRRASARPRIDSEGMADSQNRLVDEITPERELLGREAYAITIAALHELPERPRMIFILNRFEEMTGREIAVQLGVSQRLVEKDISRVLTHLRERLT